MITKSQTMNERMTSVALKCSEEFEGCGASGIIISDDLIITHGSLLNKKVTSDRSIHEFFVNMTSGELKIVPIKLRNDAKIRIYQRKIKNFDITDDKRLSEKKITFPNFVTSPEISNKEIIENKGSLIIAWKCPLLENTFNELFSSWSFDKTREYDRSLLSIFIIVRRIKYSTEISSFKDEISQVSQALVRIIEYGNNSMSNPARGLNIEISSTPFGNPVFIDSISRGIVSNVFGDDGCIILTDANAVPGSEGAPVYVTRSDGTRSYICGMVIAPLSWCRGEWVDYTFAACILPCLRRLLRTPSINQRLVDQSEKGIADSLDKSLVLVRCGDGWGTGIIFDVRTGTIITCSHVVHKAPESRIKVVLRRGDDSQSSGSSSPTWSSAKLVYRTAKDEPYDIAVLRLKPRELEHTLRSIKIADHRSIHHGEAVGTAGFPFFYSRFPTITRGNISGIDECMLRTTCCVQSGSSGGPIVRWSNGEMLGMVVCNAIATNKTKLYPRLNMAVPVSILEPPISEYLRTRDVKALDALSSNDPIVKRMWNFNHLPSSKI